MSSLEPASRRLIRLVVVPACLLVGFSGAAFALAKLHPAKPGAPKAGGPLALGDAARGKDVFAEKCAGCHGTGGEGGGVGPRLAGASISLANAKAQIDAGSGTMPANLVSGRAEQDVLAFLETILAQP